MRKKRWLALALASVMSLSMLAGCGSEEGSTNEPSNSEGENTQTPSEDGDTGEIVTLKWVAVGNGMPDNYDAWKEQVDAYVGEKIGVNIDMEVVSWDAWENRRSVLATTGGDFDILFTDQTRYNAEVSTGVFMDITELLQSAAPDLYSMIPEDYWTAVSVNDKIYAVPTYKDSSATNYLSWDVDMAEKYDIDYQNIHDLAGLYDGLKAIREGEGTAPFKMSSNGASFLLLSYDDLGTSLSAIGVKYDDETRTVINPIEDPEFQENIKMVHQMYADGIINGDAPTSNDSNGYRTLMVAQGWSGAAKTNWGPNNGIENCEAIQIGPSVVSNMTVRGSLNGISNNCEHPEKALEFLQLINTDSYVRDLFYYGVEDDNWEYDADGKVHKLKEDPWSMAGYTQATFFNVTQLDTDEFNQWDEVRTLNENATPSVMLGFNMDTSNIETELANCRTVWEKYKSELLTGARDPEELIPQMVTELEAAGWQTIADEAQSQIDAYYGQ